MINFDRNSAFSIELKDPDNDRPLNIIELITIRDDLYIFTSEAILKMLLADSIDPDKVELNTKHSYEKIADIGCSSEYIARVIIQASKLISFIIYSDIEKDKILSHLLGLNFKLLNCNSIVSQIKLGYQELLPKCGKIISDNYLKNSIPALPKIPELDSKVRVFLTNAKLVIIDIFKFLSLFYLLPINDRDEAHFNKHIENLKKNLGADNEIVKLLEEDLEWIQILAECRNAIEHSGEGQLLKIENFSIKPGNLLSTPTWTYDLTRKLNIKKGPDDLLNDLDVFCSNMLHLIEDMIILTIQDKLRKYPLLALYKLNEQDYDPKCPVRYDITLKANI
ncbi:hypothetical protein ACINWC323_0214 [Acinetobacter sp. WC-323]|uniref:hypothetical protein n=1 Tax=Acinetobacter sp. WC-323 TaxID=903918 RepID=UPI00029E8DB0|nr:hypothetical protein [Acinetobacter sp. WC-323]EKU59278.1 hypothetical protein ACINWC323_0214 [Acinetobacter sp. WC-323]